MLYTFVQEDFSGRFMDLTNCACARLAKRTKETENVQASPDDIYIYDSMGKKISHGIIGNAMLNGEFLSHNWFSETNFEEIKYEFETNPNTVATIEIEWRN